MVRIWMRKYFKCFCVTNLIPKSYAQKSKNINTTFTDWMIPIWKFTGKPQGIRLQGLQFYWYLCWNNFEEKNFIWNNCIYFASLKNKKIKQPDTELWTNQLNSWRTWWQVKLNYRCQQKMAQPSSAWLVSKLLSPTENDWNREWDRLRQPINWSRCIILI